MIKEANTENVYFVKGEKRDLDELIILYGRFVQEGNPKLTPRLDWWRNLIDTNLDSDNYTLVIAVKDSKIVGFIDYYFYSEPSDGKTHTIGQHFYVSPEYRHTKVSYILYKIFLRHSKEMGVASLKIGSIGSRLWLKKGYRPIETIFQREVKPKRSINVICN